MTSPTLKSISDGIPSALPDEMTDVLARGQNVRVERIVSRGHQSPDGFWYDQDEHEWVALLAGAAKIRFDGETERIKLLPGNHILIPAHTRHRVEWTDPHQDTIWLAVFFSD